jgi:excisionase family DNA binding protein
MTEALRTPEEAARVLRCSKKTLAAHIRSGALRYIVIGCGAKRPRRMFADEDLKEFIENQRRRETPCPSTVTRARRSTTSISNSVVLGFTAAREQRTSEKPKA